MSLRNVVTKHAVRRFRGHYEQKKWAICCTYAKKPHSHKRTWPPETTNLLFWANLFVPDDGAQAMATEDEEVEELRLLISSPGKAGYIKRGMYRRLEFAEQNRQKAEIGVP